MTGDQRPHLAPSTKDEEAAGPGAGNASLRAWRRLDWRFLLRELPVGVVLHQGVADDLVSALHLLEMDEVHQVAAGGWSRHGDGSVGLVVLGDPSAANLAEAARVLAPTGSLYVELRRRTTLTPDPRSVIGVGRALRSAGLAVHPYWHAPDHVSSTRIVPLDQRAAVRSTLLRYDAVRFGLLKSVLGRVALRLGLVPLAVSHSSVVAFRDPVPGDGPALNLLQRRLSTEVGPEALHREGLQADAAIVLLTPGFPTSRHVIGLVQEDRTGEARLVVKIPRRPYDNAGVSREAVVLRDVVRRAPALEVAVPQVLALVDERHHLVLVETALTGTVLDPAHIQADPDGAIRSGLAFIDSLALTQNWTAAAEGWFDLVVQAPLARFGAQLGAALPDGADLVRRTLDQLAGLAAAALPLVFEHGDLSHPNLFLHPEQGLRVIDWERSTPDGLVGLDLVFYLQYVAESRASAYTRDAQLRVFEQTFLQTTGWGRDLLAKHLRSRSVDVLLLPEILLAAWSRTAATLVDRLVPSESGTSGGPLSAADLAMVAEDRDVMLWRRALEHLEDERPQERHPDA